MAAVLATYRSGKVELSEPVGWPDGTQVEVVLIPPAAASQAESYRDFILRLAGAFGDAFEECDFAPKGQRRSAFQDDVLTRSDRKAVTAISRWSPQAHHRKQSKSRDFILKG